MSKNNKGYRSTGDWSTGNWSTGDGSTGHRSTGDWSTGHRSTGDWSTGYGSTGNGSTGDWSTGHRSTGAGSTGNWSTGYRSTGHRSTGDWSTGNWSTGNFSVGHLSTDDYAPFGAFNKPLTKQEWDDANIPNFFYYKLTEWITEDKMTDKEKESYPSYVTTGGYLKCKTDKEAWRESWDKAPREDREKCLSLPNWDNEIFKEISGIDVEKELNLQETEVTLEDIAKWKGVDVKNIRIKD